MPRRIRCNPPGRTGGHARRGCSIFPWLGGAALLLAGLALLPLPAGAGESRCYGTSSQGRLEAGVQLPARGSNFSAYSDLGVSLGRTYLHSRVARAVTGAYASLAREHPEWRYVYGETGWAAGGSFKPHRTHQNGLSVDFFVPVRNEKGESVPLPTDASSRYGYDLEFDRQGRQGPYRIDFAALAEHLYQLDQAARREGIRVSRVILDPALHPLLFATPRGPYLRRHLSFMQQQAWVRHDEHYHVDFSAPCLPLRKT